MSAWCIYIHYNVELFASLYGAKGQKLKLTINDSLEYVGLLERKQSGKGELVASYSIGSVLSYREEAGLGKFSTS